MPNKENRIENLRKANEESHRVIVESLRDALYGLLAAKDIEEIKVVDLVKAAGVSRGAFYKHFYLITDVLRDDIHMVAEDVRNAVGTDVELNWRIILNAIYRYKTKIPLLLKAGMGGEILTEINESIRLVEEPYKLRIAAWNGVIFNSMLYWASHDFREDPEELSKQLTEITKAFFTVANTETLALGRKDDEPSATDGRVSDQ